MVTRELFPYGKPVTGEDLVDRKEVIEKIIYEVLGGQSVILASPRRYGKSSVILESLRQIRKKGVFTCYVDLFQVASLNEFAERIAEGVLFNETNLAKKILKMAKDNLQEFLKRVEFKTIWQDNEIILTLGRPEIDGLSLLDDMLDFPQVYAKKKGKKMVFAIDEFGDLKIWDKSLLKRMRAKFQRHDLVTYIFSGSQESLMFELFHHKAEAFYGFGKSIELGPLPREDLTSYLKTAYRKGDFEIDKEALSFLVEKTNCHPHYTKLLAQSILDVIPKDCNKITTEDVQKGFISALVRVKGELDQAWESLIRSPLQRQIAKLIAFKKEHLYSKEAFPNKDKSQIYLALAQLEKKGIVKKINKGKYIFTHPFFAPYIREIEGESI